MNLIFFKREEEEPLRQSYDRKMVYILKNSYLYHRRFSIGRIQEDILELVPLNPFDVEKIMAGLQELEGETEIEAGYPMEDEHLHLRYELMSYVDGQILDHRYSAPEKIIWEKYKSVDQFWRLLQDYVSNKPFTHAPEIRRAPKIELELTIQQQEGKKRGDVQKKEYSLKNNVLSYRFLRKDRHEENKVFQIEMNNWQVGNLAHFLELQQGNLSENYEPKWTRSSGADPFVFVSLKYSYDNIEVEFAIEDCHSLLQENLSFLIVELLEKQLTATWTT